MATAKKRAEPAAEDVAVVPIGGAQAISRFLRQFGPLGADLRLAGLCDVGEESVFRRGLIAAEVGEPRTRADMEALGFFVCVDDLEDELIRAVRWDTIEHVVATQGDQRSLRTLQKQAAWRDQPVEAQLRRFIGSGARRKLRYARLLTEAVDLDNVPRPLDAALAHT